MATRNKFIVTVSHPTGFHSGSHPIEVALGSSGERYCTAADFGCSRDYFVSTDVEAIKLFLAEHACSVVKVVDVAKDEARKAKNRERARARRDAYASNNMKRTPYGYE